MPSTRMVARASPGSSVSFWPNAALAGRALAVVPLLTSSPVHVDRRCLESRRVRRRGQGAWSRKAGGKLRLTGDQHAAGRERSKLLIGLASVQRIATLSCKLTAPFRALLTILCPDSSSDAAAPSPCCRRWTVASPRRDPKAALTRRQASPQRVQAAATTCADRPARIRA